MNRSYAVLGILFIAQLAYAQNAVTLLMPMHRASSAILCRTINVPMVVAAPAVRVAQLNKNDVYSIGMKQARVNVEIERVIASNSLKNPARVYGPYKYLKAFSKASNNPLLVNEKYIDNWKHINTTGYYNGAHHLINKSTIKLIYLDLKAKGKEVRLEEMQANAPAIFNPLHGNQDFREVFHDSEQQYYDYKRFGMKVTVISLLERIDEVGMSLGFEPYPQEYLNGVLKEAELWCKYWGCCWE